MSYYRNWISGIWILPTTNILYLQGYFSEPRAMFLCNEGDGHTGQFVYIKDEREEQEYLGLCEVQVFPVQSRF